MITIRIVDTPPMPAGILGWAYRISPAPPIFFIDFFSNRIGALPAIAFAVLAAPPDMQDVSFRFGTSFTIILDPLPDQLCCCYPTCIRFFILLLTDFSSTDNLLRRYTESI
jgi:hypothetical protein